MANNPSAKKLQIDKATQTMVLIVAAAAFVTLFTIISSHNLITLLSYQDKVIDARSADVNQLNNDIAASNQLVASYQKFDNTGNTNLLGASASCNPQSDCDNAKIVLDALPSVYDYPALITSIQSLLSNQGVNIDSITGTDEQASVNPSPGASSPTAAAVAPTTATKIGNAVAMPFSFSIDGPYQNVENVITTFEKSIRPFQFNSLTFSGSQSDVTLTATARTFYQPAADFKITTETVQ